MCRSWPRYSTICAGSSSARTDLNTATSQSWGVLNFLCSLAPRPAILDGSGSFDADGDSLSYSWDLGDGNSDTNAIVMHSYPQGVYSAELTVDDSNGGMNTAPGVRIVSGNERPSAAVTQPADQTRYNAGQTFSFSGTGMDPEEGAIPCAQFTWKAALHRQDFVHAFFGPVQGICSGSFTIPVSGVTSPDVFYRVTLAVSDTGNPVGAEAVLIGTHSIDLLPRDSNDQDVDGVMDAEDNCPTASNPGQEDADSDAVGDTCDNCISVANRGQENSDGDAEGDACDTDDDNDGVFDGVDASSLDPTTCEDVDSDGCDDCSIGVDQFGPLADNTPANDGTDTDSDGPCDAGDNCVFDPNPSQTDTDQV